MVKPTFKGFNGHWKYLVICTESQAFIHWLLQHVFVDIYFKFELFQASATNQWTWFASKKLLCIFKLSGRGDTNHGQTNIPQSLKGMEDCWKIHCLKMYLLLKMGIFQLDMLVFYQCDRIYKRLLYGIQSYCQNMTKCQFTSNTTWYSLQVIVTWPKFSKSAWICWGCERIWVWNKKHSTSKQNRKIWMNLWMYANAWFPEETGLSGFRNIHIYLPTRASRRSLTRSTADTASGSDLYRSESSESEMDLKEPW